MREHVPDAETGPRKGKFPTSTPQPRRTSLCALPDFIIAMEEELLCAFHSHSQYGHNILWTSLIFYY